MKERPILFSAPMVNAILEGRKTMTRRIVKASPVASDLVFAGGKMFDLRIAHHVPLALERCPYGVPGDRLWVRETWAKPFGDRTMTDGERPIVYYRADGPPKGLGDDGAWRPSIHMPRATSRIDLEVTAVRTERLQSITAADVKAEGVAVPEVDYSVSDDPRTLDEEREAWARGHFATLWESINGERASWASNPWVWCVSFKRVRP